MHRIDTPTAQADKFGAGKNGFTRGNPQTGVPATALDDDYCDAVQEEIVGVIEGAGIALNKDNRTQLLAALKKLFLQSGNNLSEIKTAGLVALAAARANLGLGTVATKDIGTGVGQIPDMSAWSFVKNADSSKWTLSLPNGFLLQKCSVVTPGATATVNAVWLIPFPIECLGVWGVDGSSGVADLSSTNAAQLPAGRIYTMGQTTTYAPVGGYGGIDIYAIGH
ncbi:MULTISPECIES: hypothetical protein [Yersinia]|jgi:hypothetical protein|uniref:hypothetical protein n=1 Tax=Yersinia TaxID=629 RepID=UPI001643D716|nr:MULTISPECIES: hypothetical protein [Yersinia]